MQTGALLERRVEERRVLYPCLVLTQRVNVLPMAADSLVPVSTCFLLSL